MVVFRVIAQILIAAALMLLAWDALASLQQSRIVLHSFQDFIGLFGARSVTTAVESWESVPEFLKQSLIYIIELPAWVILSIIGLLMAWLFRSPVDRAV